MLAYIVIVQIILMSSILFAFEKGKHHNVINNIYLFFIGILLILFSGFRGDFTSDYKGYASLFQFYNLFEFSKIFTYQFGQEIGYVLLNRCIGIFTHNSIFIMLASSAITITLYFREIKKYSSYVWLSVLLFVTIGQYYTSFNLIRQILAASIIFTGSRYLYDKKMVKYFIVIFIASLFHKTALIMIPFYFILNFKFNIKKLLLAMFFLLLSMIYIGDILFLIQKYFYSNYVSGLYGMTGYSIKNIILPLSILVFVLWNKPKLNFNNNINNAWLNCIVFYAFFSVMGMKIQMIERIAQFFAPYALLLIPLTIQKQKDSHLRIMYIVITIIISIAYNYITLKGTGYDPFYFISSRV